MSPVRRDQVLDYVTYEERRANLRPRLVAERNLRRVPLGSVLTVCFENIDTVWYQIQEMVRTERMVREADIQHEIDTYNELLGEPGELGGVLLVEIDDPDERERTLRRWLDLPAHVFVRLDDGSLIRATYDARQVGATRLSAVQFVKFPTRNRVPVAVGCDHPDLQVETPLTEAQRAALQADLRGQPPTVIGAPTH